MLCYAKSFLHQHRLEIRRLQYWFLRYTVTLNFSSSTPSGCSKVNCFYHQRSSVFDCLRLADRSICFYLPFSSSSSVAVVALPLACDITRFTSSSPVPFERSYHQTFKVSRQKKHTHTHIPPQMIHTGFP